MSATEQASTPQPVPDAAALATYATTTRTDLSYGDVLGAIQGAMAAWPWPRVQAEVIGMLNRGETPYDLRAACADPRKTSRPWERH